MFRNRVVGSLFLVSCALLIAAACSSSGSTSGQGGAATSASSVGGAGDGGSAASGTAGGTTCSGCGEDGCCGPSCGYADDVDCAVCDSAVGLTEPMLPCTAERPCKRLLKLYKTVTELTEPTAIPTCKTSAEGRPSFDDSPPLQWPDPVDGITRYACEARPTGTSPAAGWPLLIYIHGSGGSADTVYNLTLLRQKAEEYPLANDEKTPGFILVATQGRNLHWPTDNAEDGSKHDTFHRDVAANRDVALVDALIDGVVAGGGVDENRIYISGWSNGARFAGFYGITRHVEPTPMGHRIAAISTYSGGDPYENIRHGHTPSCKLQTYPTSDVPFKLFSRTCDMIACDAAQANKLASDPTNPMVIGPGNIAQQWFVDLEERVGAQSQWQLINGLGGPAVQCNDACGPIAAFFNHATWPDAFEKPGEDHEVGILEFLRAHPLR